MSDRPTYARAVAGYDQQFWEYLTAEIATAIARASMVADANVLAIRITKTLDALADVLVAVLAMVPHIDCPAGLHRTAKALAKRVKREVSAARAAGVADELGMGASRWGGHA